MDQSSRNILFVQVYLNEIHRKLNQDDLSDKLLNELNRDYKHEDNPIFDLRSVIENIEDKSAKNMFILMQFTKERNWTDYLADVFKHLGQNDLANKLKEYNKSEPFREYDDPDALVVTKCIVTKSGDSMCYPMRSKPRGVCLIVLNETELEIEAQAFKNVFTQLYFKIELVRRKSAQQIRELFTKAANNQKYKKMDAVVTVCIGHGQNDNFLGHHFNPDKNPGDQIAISDLIDIFSNKETDETPLNSFEREKPRIHLFNCCRVQTDHYRREINLEKYQQLNWSSKNAHTTIIYACAKGIESEYHFTKKKREGWSFFGRAFIHTLAQFAHIFSFEEILNKTNHRLKVEGNQQYLPQVVKHFCTLKLHFNPGIPRDNPNLTHNLVVNSNTLL